MILKLKYAYRGVPFIATTVNLTILVSFAGVLVSFYVFVLSNKTK